MEPSNSDNRDKSPTELQAELPQPQKPTQRVSFAENSQPNRPHQVIYIPEEPAPPSPEQIQYIDDVIQAIDFTEKSVRRAFIRKVYSILSLQLGVTVSLIALFIYNQNVQEFTITNPVFFIFVFVVFIVTLLMLLCPCCVSIRRQTPGNYICLGVFTLACGTFLGVISIRYGATVVIIAIGATALISFGLTLFAFQTKFDFTTLNGSLFVILLVFIIFGFFTGFLREVYPMLNIIYSAIGVLIFSLYMVYDTQLIMGGKHKITISPEEYIFAALNIYLDVINIFILLLALIGGGRND